MVATPNVIRCPKPLARPSCVWFVLWSFWGVKVLVCCFWKLRWWIVEETNAVSLDAQTLMNSILLMSSSIVFQATTTLWAAFNGRCGSRPFRPTGIYWIRSRWPCRESVEYNQQRKPYCLSVGGRAGTNQTLTGADLTGTGNRSEVTKW